MKRIPALFCAAVFLAGCGGRSDAAGEVVPIDRICAYEKWKTVAVEGYLASIPTACKRGKNRRGRELGILWCHFNVYAERTLTGPSLSVEIPTMTWYGARNNTVENPLGLMRLYDNDANPTPPGSRIRVFGTLPKSDRCQFGLVERIDRIS